MHFPNSFEWIQSEGWFRKLHIVAKIFDTPSNDKKVWKKNIYIYTIQYAI